MPELVLKLTTGLSLFRFKYPRIFTYVLATYVIRISRRRTSPKLEAQAAADSVMFTGPEIMTRAEPSHASGCLFNNVIVCVGLEFPSMHLFL
jgi:hypothetical protein